MPLSEFHRAATKGKPESNQSRTNNCSSADLSSLMPDNEFVELLWENGQIVRKSFLPTTPFPSPSLKAQERGSRDAKIGLFEPSDSPMANDDSSLSVPVPSSDIGMHARDDDMVPWMNYPVDDHRFGPEFFSELSGIHPADNDRDNGFVGVKDFDKVEHGHGSVGVRKEQESTTRIRPGQLFRSPQQCQTSIPCRRPRAADFSAGGGGSGINPQGQFQKLDLLSTSKPFQPAGSVANFSHFSRPAVLSKAKLDHGDGSKGTKEASPVATSTKPMESTMNGCTGVRGTSSMDLAKRETKSAAKLNCLSLETSEVAAYRNSHRSLHNSSFAASLAIGRHTAEKGPEAVVASSVCSGGGDTKPRQRRKNREGEESGYQSEDLDDDSVGVRKPTTTRAGASTKRSRAAEVHNLSERKRRDRINEKMRALQELIPNCNKVDKASMLDEAIEYLKTLQLQVQMMSMGSGLCMSPMMLPPGMQHIRTPPMAHFPVMGLGMGMGMGMGMGYGMGMLDMNGSPGCSLTPQFPCTSMAGATGMRGVPGSSTGVQLFGVPGQGQGLPVSVPHAQFFNPFPCLPPKANPLNEVSGTMVNPVPVSDAAPSSRCKDQQLQQRQQNMNMENTQKASTSESQVEKDSLPQISDQALHIGQNGAVHSISDNTNISGIETSFC